MPHRFTATLLALFLAHGLAAHADTDTAAPTTGCVGTTTLPPDLASQFDAVEDSALLAKAIGQPLAGGLCQGQVYQSKADSHVVLFRAWNSTNPNSKFGGWWAFSIPEGRVADYRRDFEICYQWSPLDSLARCTLKPGVEVVVGNGQSAQCSQYLTYPVSDKQQVYIDNASASLLDCSTADGMFSWQ